MKRLLSLLVSLTLLFALSACAAPARSASTLIYGSGDYTAINPALFEHGEINSLLFTGLTAHNQDNRVIPALAESWTFDAPSNTYTFTLRKNVTWHDGQPFTAGDVVFTLEAIRDPANASEIASNYEDVVSVEAPDDHTVRLVLSAPNVAMLDYLSVGMLPKHLLEGKDLTSDPYNQAPVGTGPYKLEAWDRGQSITLKRNEDFYLGAPKIETIIFKIVPDVQSRALQLQAGELDLAQITPQDAASFAGNENYETLYMRTADYRGILYNFNHPLFARFRELPAALSWAVDRQAIVDTVLLGRGQVAYSPLQAGPYNNPHMERYAYDPEKAAALLAEAGWTAGADGVLAKEGERLSFTIHCSEGDQVRVDMAQLCAQQLNAVGAEVKVSVDAQIDWAGQAAYLIGWGSPFDPDDHTYKVFGTDKGANYSGYSNPAVDGLLQQARETDDDAARKDYYLKFQQELAKDPPFTFLAYVDAVYVARNTLKGVTPDTVLGHHGVGVFWNVYDWSWSQDA